MMESSNLNLDLHHQEEFHASSSALILPSLQDLILNNSISLPMVQELGFQWGIDHGESYLINQEDNYQPKSHNQQHNMKELGININLQDQYSLMPSHVKHEFNQMNGFVETNYESMCMDNINSRRGSLSMVLPSANVSSLNYINPLYSTSTLGMSQPSFMINNSIDLTRENNEFSLGQLQQESTHASVPTNNHKVSLSSVISGVTEAKRSSSNSTLNCKASQTAPKKPRFESRPSFTPFKVRKEKLGDRIAALQQLVSPFGKTDTASVLTEATGYIKFLQHQVETLSVPYMSNNKRENSQQEASTEEKRDLRSRGLCLVPLSCMSYVTNDNSGVWSPTNYRGGT